MSLNVAISGWGTTTRGWTTPADELRICSMTVRNNSMHHPYVGAGNSAYELGNIGTGVIGAGDSGAGLYYDGRIFGIVIAGDEVNLAWALQINYIYDWIMDVSGIDQAMAGTVWCHTPNAHTYYRSGSGRVVVATPYRLVDLWHQHRAPDEDHFELA